LPLPKIGINNMLSVNSLYRNSYKDSFDSLYESILNDFDIDNVNPLFEVSIDAPRYFKQLEIDLDIFTKKKYKDFSKAELNKIAKQLSKTLNQILNVDTEVKIDNFKNCMVYPQYYFLEERHQKVDKDNKLIIEESLLNVKKVYFFIDIKMFMYDLKLTPSELVGILLHEIGHVTYHRNFITHFFDQFLNRFKFGVNLTSLVATSPIGLLIFLHRILPPQVLLVIILIGFLITRTLSIFEHKQEYYCDKFAVKYGYGDEIASAFIKLDKFMKKTSEVKKRGILKKIIDFIKTIFNSTSHPSNVNRICNIAEKLKKDYINSYPKIKITLERDLNRLGC
jgi:hypothetical protein